MKRRLPWIAAVIVLLVVAATLWQVRGHRKAAAATLELAGGDGGGLPRARPEAENFAPAALAAAVDTARTQGAQAFLVLRHGHLVSEYYGDGFDAESRMDAGAFAAALVALSAGIARGDGLLRELDGSAFDAQALAARIATASGLSYPQFLSARLWRPLNAGAAQWRLEREGAEPRADCCLAARAADWLRVAVLLLEDGRFEGNEIVPAGWAQRMRAPLATNPGSGFGLQLARSASGLEPFAADEVYYLRGNGRWRLWMAPQLQLAVLLAADAVEDANDGGRWDETRLFNQVIRSLTDHAAGDSGRSLLRQLVPNH